MTTWEERAEHLANHFKLGKTMADWDGDWGFDLPILQIIENAIPPCKNTKTWIFYQALLTLLPRHH